MPYLQSSQAPQNPRLRATNNVRRLRSARELHRKMPICKGVVWIGETHSNKGGETNRRNLNNDSSEFHVTMWCFLSEFRRIKPCCCSRSILETRNSSAKHEHQSVFPTWPWTRGRRIPLGRRRRRYCYNPLLLSIRDSTRSLDRRWCTGSSNR